MATDLQGAGDVIVTVIDTGVRATHVEFNFVSADDTSDQFVGWYDFSSETDGTPSIPAPGQTWDSRVKVPFDRHGHGTATASAAVGRNSHYQKTKSFCPGCKLAVAKVGGLAQGLDSDAVTMDGDIDAAIRWAVSTVKTDVISISIGPVVPLPGMASMRDESIAWARGRGVLVTVANGNGLGNVGLVPGDPGWANPYSDAALAVGSDEAIFFGKGQPGSGSTHTSDPEVTAPTTQFVAGITSDTELKQRSGTSLAAPLVAGAAARLMEVAIENGRSPSVDYIETLIKYTAIDTNALPQWEGYGTLAASTEAGDAAWFTSAKTHAARGTLPARPNPDVNRTYVERFANGMREINNHFLDVDLLLELRPTGIGAGANGAGRIGASSENGIQDVDAYAVTVTAGQKVTFTLSITSESTIQGDQDLSLFLFEGTGPFTYGNWVAASERVSPLDDSISYDSPAGGTYTLLVVGSTVGGVVTYSPSGNVAFVSEDYYTGFRNVHRPIVPR